MRNWLAEALMPTVVHGVMVAGLLSGFWDPGVCIVGILLDGLAAFALWFAVQAAGRGPWDRRALGMSFIGLSIGVWGFIAMFRAINLQDTAFLAMNFAVLKYLDPSMLEVASGLDGDAALVVLVILAAALLLVSLYFLGEILFAMPIGDVASLAACVLVLRIVELLGNYGRIKSDEIEGRIAQQEMSALGLHLFVKGWVGALLIYLGSFTDLPVVWTYLGWSFAHDLVIRPLLGRMLPGDPIQAPQQARA